MRLDDVHFDPIFFLGGGFFTNLELYSNKGHVTEADKFPRIIYTFKLQLSYEFRNNATAY